LNRRIIQLILCLCFAVAASGCAKMEYYHPEHGFESQSPEAFKEVKSSCREAGYAKYPAISAPNPPMYNYYPTRYCGRYAYPTSCSTYYNSRQWQYDHELREYNKYNRTRTDHINECLKGKGWERKEVPEE